jgi:hypothetical protein
MALLAQAGHALPNPFENLDVLTPFGAIYRYQDYDAVVCLNRDTARASVRELRAFSSGNAPTNSYSATPPAVWVPSSQIRLFAAGNDAAQAELWRRRARFWVAAGS